MNKRTSVIVFLLPALLILLAIAIVPTVKAIIMSFQNRSLFFATSSFVGFSNYKEAFFDPRFINALKVSAIWELLTVLGSMSFATSLAVFTFEYCPLQVKRVLRVLMILPITVPRVSASFIWKFIYSPVVGLTNYFLSIFSIQPVALLSNNTTALFAVAWVDIWQWGSLFGVIILGVLESLPKNKLEAARIDGANLYQLYRYIVLPWILMPVISLTLVKGVQSLRAFDYIYIMTKGGPGISTETLDMYIYNVGINIGGELSYASSMSVLLLILTLLAFGSIWRVVQGAN